MKIISNSMHWVWKITLIAAALCLPALIELGFYIWFALVPLTLWIAARWLSIKE